MTIEGVVGLVVLAAIVVYVWKKVTAEKSSGTGTGGGGNGANSDLDKNLK